MIHNSLPTVNQPMENAMKLPGAIYELLPFVYALVSLSTIVNNEIWLGRLSGALLLSASVVIFTLRNKYRHG